jgi:serine kinase of HPr protein (carbohydrate metabolism regulator)
MTASPNGPETIHATALLIGERGVLLRGPSGAGKSDLAFRLMRGRWAARLVADDRSVISNEGGHLVATAPAPLKALLELRGLGLLEVPYAARATLHLMVDLVPRDDVPRMPDPAAFSLCGLTLPRIALHAFDLTTPDKVGLAAQFLPVRGFPGEDGVIGFLAD